MTPSTKAALQISLNEMIKNRDNLEAMAEQYELRAKIIRQDEVPEINKKIEDIRGDLE